MSSSKSLLLAGCGNMGGALLARWQQLLPAGISQIIVVEPHNAIPHASNVTCVPSLDAVPADFLPDIIVLAVKPQQLEEMLPHYRDRFSHKPLYLSIAAGKGLDFFATHLGEHAYVVRAMPNTPAMVGKGMTVLCARNTLAESSRAIATQLMQAVGIVEWVSDESQMHAVTALSGSGPAYVFLFLDALTQAGIELGLPENISRTLAMQTVEGSVELAKNSNEDFGQLRQNVTSKGGTTEAALNVLMAGDALKTLIHNALTAASWRSKQLSD